MLSLQCLQLFLKSRRVNLIFLSYQPQHSIVCKCDKPAFWPVATRYCPINKWKEAAELSFVFLPLLNPPFSAIFASEVVINCWRQRRSILKEAVSTVHHFFPPFRFLLGNNSYSIFSGSWVILALSIVLNIWWHSCWDLDSSTPKQGCHQQLARLVPRPIYRD